VRIAANPGAVTPTIDEALGHRQALGGVELGRLAELPEHGDAGRAGAQVEPAQAVDRCEIDRAVFGERCRGDRVNAACLQQGWHGVEGRSRIDRPVDSYCA